MWQTIKLGEVATIVAGQSPKGENYNRNGMGMPFYQGKKNYGDRYLKPPSVWTTEIKTIANSGDILMSARAPVGAVNIAAEAICIGRGLFAFQANSSIDRNYLYYFLLVTGEKLEGKTGAIFNSINKKQIENINIPLPPLAEQQRIVDKLDKGFAEIDKVTLNKETKKNELHELKKSLVNAELNKNLDGMRLDFERCLEKVKIPPKLKKKAYLKNGKYPVVAQEDALINGYSNDKDIVCVLDSPLIIFGDHTRKLKYIDFDFVLGADGAKLIKPKPNINVKFFCYYLSLLMPKSIGYARHYKFLKKLNFIIPTLAEQQRIVDTLDKGFAEIDRIMEITEKQINQYKALKSAILAQELQGEAI